MKNCFFILVLLVQSCAVRQAAWEPLCEHSTSGKAAFLVSNIGQEDFVQCKAQEFKNGTWLDLSPWGECADLEANRTISRQVETSGSRLRILIGDHSRIEGWCTIIDLRGERI